VLDESKLLIAMVTAKEKSEPPTVVLGMTPPAWQHMQSGETHTVDLRKVGINVQIVIFTGSTQKEMIAVLQDSSSALGGSFTDARGGGKLPDLGIDEKEAR